MSFMTIQPDMVAAAASDLSAIGAAISADNAAARHVARCGQRRFRACW